MLQLNLTLLWRKIKFALVSSGCLVISFWYQIWNPILNDSKRCSTFLFRVLQKSSKRVYSMSVYYAKWIPNFSQKARCLLLASHFPIGPEVERAFTELKNGLGKASLVTVQAGVPFEIGTDASDNAIAVLSQGGRPVAFISRTLSHCEKRYPGVEREATAVIEAVRKWQHFLEGRYFTIVTDQEASSFMFDQRHHGKKNTNTLWRLELGQYIFDIRRKPGVENVAPDTFSRMLMLRLESPSSNYTNILVTQVMLVFITSFVSVAYISQMKKPKPYAKTVIPALK